MGVKFAIWLLDNVYLGRFAPYVLGLALGRLPKAQPRDEKGGA